MSSLDAENLRTVTEECRGFLREDIIQALEAAAAEIDRLQEVVRRLQQEKRELKKLVPVSS